MPDENGDKTFVKITNRMIYDELICIKKDVSKVVTDTEQNKIDIKRNRQKFWWLVTAIVLMAASAIAWAAQTAPSVG